jgi:two-component system, OmpR family, osmolarity sensor histidine kinase EnvZ
MTVRGTSTVARMTWLVAGIALLSLLLYLLVVWLWVQPLAQDLTAVLAGRARLTREVLLQAPAQQRAALADRLGGDGFEVRRLEPRVAASASAPAPPRAPLLLDLQRRAGGDFVVSGRGPRLGQDGALHLDFQADPHEHWRLSFRIQVPLVAFLGTGMVWLLLVGMAVFLSLAVGVRFIGRPMTQLAQLLAAQGTSLRPLPVPPRAGRELQLLVGAFNRLARAVAQADETKQHLLAGVSHDLRTPLSRLRLRIETECEEPLAERLTADIRALERIVSQFLAYVQGESGAGLGEPESAAQLVMQSVNAYRQQDQPVSVQVVELTAPVPDLALQRALGNLVDNALAHGRPPVLVELSARGIGSEAEGVLTVWDHGAGMPPGLFARAQLPFVRLEGQPALSGHCGLGLAIVARIAHQLGGRLEQHFTGDGRYGISLTWPLHRRWGDVAAGHAA